MSLTTHVAIHSAAIHTSSGDGSSSDLGPIMSLVVLALMILPLAIVAFTFFEVKTDFAASRLLRQMRYRISDMFDRKTDRAL